MPALGLLCDLGKLLTFLSQFPHLQSRGEQGGPPCYRIAEKIEQGHVCKMPSVLPTTWPVLSQRALPSPRSRVFLLEKGHTTDPSHPDPTSPSPHTLTNLKSLRSLRVQPHPHPLHDGVVVSSSPPGILLASPWISQPAFISPASTLASRETLN